MMKDLPTGVNYTWRNYFNSWNLDYDLEMAKRELSNETAKNIENQLPPTMPLRYVILLYVSLTAKPCENDLKSQFQLYSTRTSKENDDETRVTWEWEYCGSDVIKQWCDKGDRLFFEMNANLIIDATLLSANATFTCPFSLYHFTTDLLFQKTRESWKFSRFFYATVGVVSAGLVAVIAVIIVVACEKQHRKISKMAHWPKNSHFVSDDYYSITGPDDSVEVVVMEQECAPIQK